MSFFWNYSRFAFRGPPGSGTGPQPGGPVRSESPQDAAQRARERVNEKRTQDQLEGLKDEIQSDKSSLILLAQFLKSEKLGQWLEPETDKKMVADKIREAFHDLKKGDPKFQEPPGLTALLAGLQADPDTAFHKNALKSLEDFVNLIDETNRQLPKTTQELKGLKEDVPTMKVEEWIGNMSDKFRRGSGTEKLLMVGSLGLAAYFLWNTKLKKYAGILGGAFALNYLVGVGSGKSVLERFGVSSTLDQLPSQVKAFAEKIGMKNPEHALGMARLGPVDIDSLYKAYAGARNGEIDPRSFALMDKELKPTELYEIINELVKQAGGREDFKRKYTGKKLKFLQVVLALNGEGSVTEMAGIFPKEKEQWTADLRKLFEGYQGKGFSIDSGEAIFAKMGTFTLPGIQRDTDMKSENPYYVFRFDSGERVKMFLKNSEGERALQIEQLTKLMQKELMKKLVNMKFVTGSIVFRNGEWVIPNVMVKGKKIDLTLRQGRDSEIEFYIGKERLPYADGGIEQAYEKFSVLDQLRRQFSVLQGVTVEVTKISGATPGRVVDGSIGGTPFQIREVSAGQFQISVGDQKNILQSSSFQEEKQGFFQEQLSWILGESKLREIAQDINEEWGPTFKLKFPFVFHLSGSFSEALWNAGVNVKKQNIIDLYLYTISHPSTAARGLTESGDAEKKFIIEILAQARSLYSELEDLVSKDKEVDEKNFKGLFDRLIGFGISNGEVRGQVTHMAERFLKEVNHEGIDQSDVLTGWTQAHEMLLNAYLSAIAPISRKSVLTGRDKEFMTTAEEKMFKKIGLFTRKSDGILWTDIHESLNAGDIGAWDLPRYEDFVGGPGDAGGGEDTGGGDTDGGDGGDADGGAEQLKNIPETAYVRSKIFDDVPPQGEDPPPSLEARYITGSSLNKDGVMVQMNWVLVHEYSAAVVKIPGSGTNNIGQKLYDRGLKMTRLSSADNSPPSEEYNRKLSEIAYSDGTVVLNSFKEQVTRLWKYRNFVHYEFENILENGQK